MVEQQSLIVAQIAQWRHGDGEHRQPVVQVGAETSVADFLAHVAIGRRDNAGIADAVLGLADALEFAVLEHAQQFCLKFERQLADFIQEQRAVFGIFEITGPRSRGAGERPFAVAE